MTWYESSQKQRPTNKRLRLGDKELGAGRIIIRLANKGDAKAILDMARELAAAVEDPRQMSTSPDLSKMHGGADAGATVC